MLSKKAIRLLRKVQAHIKEEPKRWSYDWAHSISREAGGPACGTQACIGGWVVLLNFTPAQLKAQLKTHHGELSDVANAFGSTEAAVILGISDHQRRILFFDWPNEFLDAGNPDVAIARIERFIQTDGAQ